MQHWTYIVCMSGFDHFDLIVFQRHRSICSWTFRKHVWNCGKNCHESSRRNHGNLREKYVYWNNWGRARWWKNVIDGTKYLGKLNCQNWWIVSSRFWWGRNRNHIQSYSRSKLRECHHSRLKSHWYLRILRYKKLYWRDRNFGSRCHGFRQRNRINLSFNR